MTGAPMRIGLCTDSNAQLPPGLADRFGVEIVPLTVIIDEHEYLEGVDLDADAYYAMWDAGIVPPTRVANPSAGQFALAYEQLADRGCTQILSIHTALEGCSIVTAARLAAHTSPIPVRLIDSGTARFGVSCCVWAASDALGAGATLEEAAAIAESLAPAVGSVFVAGEGLRSKAAGGGWPRPVIAIYDRGCETIAEAESTVDAVNAMARYVLDWGQHLNVAIGAAHLDTIPIAEALGSAIGESANVREVVHYRLGPSVGAELGPGAVGCVMYPA
ncbi:MAG TPA: DegV family protein [Ilumatobacteraceae bacterium]|nr:DegV family protein [Ilumatobacteraceae bacterium]